ncbi:MAG: hypothetical protein PSX71_08800 [bacterium]|nr:hypothetical protein [bacterium]
MTEAVTTIATAITAMAASLDTRITFAAGDLIDFKPGLDDTQGSLNRPLIVRAVLSTPNGTANDLRVGFLDSGEIYREAEICSERFELYVEPAAATDTAANDAGTDTTGETAETDSTAGSENFAAAEVAGE